MEIVMFYHSLLSDWNHGNAHFLRGIVSELQGRGHTVNVYEPANSWSKENLLKDHGDSAIEEFQKAYPRLRSTVYNTDTIDLDDVLQDADMVIVHEWNDLDLVRNIGEHRKNDDNYRLFFHDTHHRSVTDRESMTSYDLSGYDGVLAFGRVIKNIYLKENWVQKAWTWHEAADTRIFRPILRKEKEGDVIWIGNWGDEERTEELYEFLINPVKELKLKAKVYGVRYPQEALEALEKAGIEYGGWLPNHKVPEEFSKYRLTVHIPRRPYAQALPGIPTIRPFEAMACGIPMISAPWKDTEKLFSPGADFLIAKDGLEMKRLMRMVLTDDELAAKVAKNGLNKILARHTCYHRVNELMDIYKQFYLRADSDSMVSQEA